MSDFISDFWSYYIAAIALLGIVWCAWLLLSQRRIKLAPGQKPDGDTGHVWDGDLRELNTRCRAGGCGCSCCRASSPWPI